VQRGFQQFDVFVKDAKQGFDPASNLYGASHETFDRPSAQNAADRKGSHLHATQGNDTGSVLERKEGVKDMHRLGSVLIQRNAFDKILGCDFGV
jgi:hypothetical protein